MLTSPGSDGRDTFTRNNDVVIYVHRSVNKCYPELGICLGFFF